MKSTLKKLSTKLSATVITLGLIVGLFFFFSKDRVYYETLTVKFEASDLPYVDVMIEGMNYSLIIDLGSRLEMDIYSDVLKRLNKSPYGTEEWKNFQGKDSKHQTYILPKVELGSLVLKNSVVVELPAKERQDYLIWKDPTQKKQPSETVGYLGRGLLKKMNFLLDIQQAKMILTNSLNKLRDNGYNLDSFIKIPFTLTSKGIVIEVKTDLGSMKLLLDTGTTWTMLHEFLYPQNTEKKASCYGFPVFTSSEFSMSGTDFGNQDLYFLTMTKELHDIDGLIGMDFIKNHVMYLDFSANVLYIQKPVERIAQPSLPQENLL